LRKGFKNDSHFKHKNTDLLTKLYSQMSISSEQVFNLKSSQDTTTSNLIESPLYSNTNAQINTTLNSIRRRKDQSYLNKEELSILIFYFFENFKNTSPDNL